MHKLVAGTVARIVPEGDWFDGILVRVTEDSVPKKLVKIEFLEWSKQYGPTEAIDGMPLKGAADAFGRRDLVPISALELLAMEAED